MPRGSDIHVKKTEGAKESAEVLASAIVQISDASRKMLEAGLTEDAIVTLLHRQVSPDVGREQIKLILRSLPRLKGWYVK